MFIPTDVPIHRPSVGAMAVTTGSQMPAKVTKPYVYRGTGEDMLTPDPPKPTPKPKRKPRAETRPRPKRARASRRRPREWNGRFWKPAKPLPPLPLPEVGEEDPEPPPSPSWMRKPRPAPGWKPMTGADLLDDLDDLLGDDG